MPQTITLKNDYREKEILDYLRFNSDQTAIMNFINTALTATTVGSSGAKYIGMTPNAAVGAQANVQDIVDGLIAILQGTGGAAFIKAVAVAGIAGGDVQTILSNLKTYLDSQDTSIINAANTHKTALLLDHPDNSVTDTKIGNRTVDQAIVAAKADAGTLVQILSWFAQSLKQYFGVADWKTAPTRTVEAINSEIIRHIASTDHNGLYYTKTQQQTSGQSSLHWDNVTNKPAFADAKWKAPVANVGALPASGNTDGDLRIVLDIDTVYTWDVDHWEAIGATGNGITDHGTLQGLNDDDHPQYLRTDGTRALGGNMDFSKNQALNLVIHTSGIAPAAPAVGQLWFDTVNVALKVYKSAGAGWVDVSGKGATIRQKEFVATAGQTVFDFTGTGTYEVGTGTMNVYKKDMTTGKYELVDKDDYAETNSTSVTLLVGASLNDQYYFKWFENSPEVINYAVQKDGTLQVNLNADKLDNNEGSYYLDRTNHTGTQAATTILEDGTHRFVTDTDKTSWDSKADATTVNSAISNTEVLIIMGV